jgi:phosphoribosylformimino-5-aminoimidazole carboxamide ribotide isomerase
MGGKIVQLVQGSRKALEFENFQEWIDRFSSYPLVQLIDLDAAMGHGDNHDIVRDIARQLPCQVGGGIRSMEHARETLSLGARRVIVGSSLISKGKLNFAFARELADEVGRDNLVFAVDSRQGRVAIKGWQHMTDYAPDDMMRALDSYCGAFLYTHIDTEGMLNGIPIEIVSTLRSCTSRGLIAAGGIRSQEEVSALEAIRVDAVVGMAIYQHLLPV